MSTSIDTTNIYLNEDLPFAVPINLLANLNKNVILLFTKGAFYRSQYNTNLELIMPLGIDISPNTIWLSNSMFLPVNFFNSTKPILEISFPNNNCVQFNRTMQYYHDITIQFKLTKNLNSDNYQNYRELRCRLVQNDGITQYDQSIFGYGQSGSGEHFEINLRGDIQHFAGDIAKLQFTIAQDNRYNDQSDTILTIFSITWNIMGLKII